MLQKEENKTSPWVSIRPPTEFSFAECLRFLDRSRQERLHLVKNGSVRKLTKLCNKLILLEVSNPKRQSVQVRILNVPPREITRLEVKNYVYEWFDLSRDLSPFYEMAERDPLLANLVREYYGLRLIRIHDLFQTLCWAIIGQQVNLSFAYMLSRRFIESFAESYEHGGRLYWLFPSTQSIAELSVVELRKLQFTQRKAEYVIGLAQQFENGELSKEKLLHYKNSNDARNVLLGIRGVGAWTANYVLMRCLGDPSAFPIEDIGLHRAIQLRLNLTRKPTIDEIRSLATGWENWQAYATFYLYRSLL